MTTMSLAMAEAIMAGSRRFQQLTLTVLYDERCPLCRRLRRWLGGQPTLAPIEFLAAASPAAQARFPALDHQRTTRTLTVVASDGAVYEGERAWLVCAWALPGWQPVAEHFGSRFRLRLVRVAARLVDGYRHRLVPDSGSHCERCAISAPTSRTPSDHPGRQRRASPPLVGTSRTAGWRTPG
jgi:predicted DCC family thiol-disulfide oxidoreductase YuxK